MNHFELKSNSQLQNEESITRATPKISNYEMDTKLNNETSPKINIVGNEERPYCCNQCETKFKKKKYLTAHFNSKHKGITYPCVQCDKQFRGQDGLLKHFQSIHQGITHSCKICGQTFATQSNVTKHFHSQHGGITYSCSKCNYEAKSNYNLKVHFKSKHEDGNYLST